jgi:hypothetical protein
VTDTWSMVEAPERTYRLTTLADVHPKPIRWMMPGRIPFGGLTILAGRPGQGKSQLTLAIASRLTTQDTDVLLIGAEDGLEDTVRPRMVATGADLTRVHSFDPWVGDREDMCLLPDDVPLLEDAVRELGVGLVVIDPVVAHLSPDLNSHSDHSLRQAMAPLARMARSTGVAVICVSHLKKGREGGPLDWIGGSVAFTGTARSVLLFGKLNQPDDVNYEKYRYLVHVKCNGAVLAPTLACEVESVTVEDSGMSIPTSRIVARDERPSVWAGGLE